MRYRQGEIEIDPEELVLIVHYEDLEEHRVRRRRIAIPSVDVDPARVAKEILRKYEYIHPSRLEEVEQKIILMLRLAQEQMDKQQQQQQAASHSAAFQSSRQNGNHKGANIAELDSYLELLYEGGDDPSPKIQGTAKLLELCAEVAVLEQLVQTQTVMGALTRVLQEEYKRSMELTFNIVRIFLAFSIFLEMHGILSTYRVGLLTMQVVEFEIKRSQHREAAYQTKLAEYDQLLRDGTSSSSEVERMKIRELSKNQRFEQRQDKLLFVAFCVLMNFAEDISVERKIIKKGIIEMLCATLTRSSVDLLVLATTFLKKLSVFEDNKAIMADTIPLLIRLLTCSSDTVILAALRLLFNLSFDPAMREQMLRGGMLPKLVQLLKSSTRLRGRILKLMYHLSVEDRCKSMFTYTEGIPIILGLIINFPQDTLAKELAALAINLSHNHRNAELMAHDGNLTHLMLRLQQTNDPLLMKIIRNISLWTFATQTSTPNGTNEYRYRGLWSPHVKSLMNLAKATDIPELQVEVLGTLANLTISDLPVRSWLTLLQDCEFAPNICRWLVPGLCQNDVILEVLMFMAQVASDKACSTFFAASTLIALAEQTWRDKAEDTEIVLQSLYLFYWLFQWPDTREEAFRGTRVVLLMIDALQHRNETVQIWADRCLQVLVATSEASEGSTLGDLQARIKWHRFEAYNRQWVRMTNNGEQWAGEPETIPSLRDMMHSSMLNMHDDMVAPSSRNWRGILDQDGDLDLEMMKAQLDYEALGLSQQYYMSDIEWPSRWS